MDNVETLQDQAETLRRMKAGNQVKVIAVSGGKGGVGKSNVSANLAVALSGMGRRVMLMDADLGLANLDVLLGLQPKQTLAQVLEGAASLEEVIVDGPAGIRVVPAASGVQRMSNLSVHENTALIRAFGELYEPVDVLIVDTAAGLGSSVVQFTRAAQQVMVVVNDEPTSLTDAYGLIKVLSRDHGIRRFQVVSNRCTSAGEGRALFEKLLKVTSRFLDVTLCYMGDVPEDPYLKRAVAMQSPVLTAFPSARSSIAFKKLAAVADNWSTPRDASGYLEFFVERLASGRAQGGQALA